MEVLTKKQVGRPKNVFKWEINGIPCRAQAYYAYVRAEKRQAGVTKANNQFRSLIVSKRLTDLLEIRDKIEILIKLELEAIKK